MISRSHKLCGVCDDVAYVVNYGAVTCPSCKTFFRRNGFHLQNNLQCNFYGNCRITKSTRRSCTACRFAKCLAIGMCRDLIRKEDISGKEKSLVQYTRQQLSDSKSIVPISKPLPLNLLNADHSSLTTANWTLISNVIHAFDAFIPTIQIRRMINSFDVPTHFEQTKTILTLINHSLQSSISSTADFRIMTLGEQYSLIQRNIHGLRALYATFVACQSRAFDNVTNTNPIVPVYGSNNIQNLQLIGSRLDPDLAIIKLMLVVLAFSSNCYALNYYPNWERDNLLIGTFRLFGSQNAYIEVMWKYMVYRYGYFQSAMRFSQLIKIVLDSMKLSCSIYEQNRFHHDLANKMMKDGERILADEENKTRPLWGKQNF